MNKKLFLKLGLLVLSLSLVACGQKNNSPEADNSSKANTNQIVNSTESSSTENVETKVPSAKNAVENKQEDKNAQKDTKHSTKQNTKKDTKQDVKKNTKQDIKQEVPEKEYYNLIKEAWQKQKDYIDSIDDPKIKQSIQTAQSAAISKSNELHMEHPKDSKAIDASLKKVLAGQ